MEEGVGAVVGAEGAAAVGTSGSLLSNPDLSANNQTKCMRCRFRENEKSLQ